MAHRHSGKQRAVKRMAARGINGGEMRVSSISAGMACVAA